MCLVVLLGTTLSLSIRASIWWPQNSYSCYMFSDTTATVQMHGMELTVRIVSKNINIYEKINICAKIISICIIM